jgi:hypothetical protein
VVLIETHRLSVLLWDSSNFITSTAMPPRERRVR